MTPLKRIRASVLAVFRGLEEFGTMVMSGCQIDGPGFPYLISEHSINPPL